MTHKIYLSILFIGCFYFANANLIFVNQQTDCVNNTGTNWNEAFCDLQEALAIAESGDTIWIAQGIYYPTNDNNRDTSFHLVSGVAIYGGFLGTENTLSARDWENNETILSGNVGDTTFSDNSYHVIKAENLDSMTVLDGLIIEGGFAEDLAGDIENRIGAGIKNTVNIANQTAWLKLQNVTLRNNRASGDNTDFRYGGSAISNQVNAGSLNLIFDNCSFENNIGKIPVMNTRIVDTLGEINIHITNTEFIENENFSSLPFIIYNGVDSSDFKMILDNCIFDGNDGAIQNESYGGNFDLKIRNSSFTNSKDRVLWVENYGGKINTEIDSCNFSKNDELVLFFYSDSSNEYFHTPAIEMITKIKNSCFFQNNNSLLDLRGGADSLFFFLENSLFQENQYNNILLYLYNTFVSTDNPTCHKIVKNCDFINNFTKTVLGTYNAYHFDNINDLTEVTKIEDCNFIDNNTDSSPVNVGFVLDTKNDTSDTLLLKNANFNGNYSNSHARASAIYMTFYTSEIDTSTNNEPYINIEQCNFFDNESINDNAIVLLESRSDENFPQAGSNIYFNKCKFRDNQAESGVVKIYNSHVVPVINSLNVNFKNSTFFGNYGGEKGVISMENFLGIGGTAANFTNCSFSNNQASSNSALFHNNSSQITAQNSIFWNYKTANNNPIPLVKSEDTGSTPENIFQNSIVQQGDENLPFTTYENMLYGVDPLFVDETSNDLHLQLCSPAISAGNNMFVESSNLLTDFDSTARIQSGIVDLGAYESPALEIFNTATPTDCLTGNDGTIDFDITNGCEPYTISWEENSTTETAIDSLTAGTQFFTITDGAGKEETVLVDIPTFPSDFADSMVENYNCSTSETGTATIVPNAGTAPYQYLWNTGIADSVLTNLLPGTYQATITDNESCIDTLSIVIETIGNLALGTNVHPISCHDSEDGIAAVTPLSGIAPYQYLWESGEMDSLLFNLSGGNYVVTVTDAINCQDELSFSISPPDSINLDLEVQNISCFEEDNGQANVFASGGTGDFNYEWNTAENNDTIANLSPGLYTVTVTDIQDCTATIEGEITEPMTIQFSTEIINATTANSMDGQINNLSISGGIPPYSYLWNTGDTTVSIIDLPSGNYSLTITDANDCQEIISFEISFNSAITTIPNNPLGFILSPNPALVNYQLLIYSQEVVNQNLQISVWDATGKLIKNLENTYMMNGEIQFLAPSEAGFYILEIRIPNGQTTYIKFLVQ